MSSDFNTNATDKVSKAGDTMTGNLIVPGGSMITGANIQFRSDTGKIAYLNSVDGATIAVNTTGGTGQVAVNSSNVLFPVQAPTASAPAYVKGSLYFDTTLNSDMIGGASAWVAAATLASGRDAPHIINKTASANVRNSHDAVATSISATYAKAKTITLNNGLVGQQRFLFDLKTSDITKTAYGRIYRNGVALGTEQTEAGLAYVTKSEDITQTWNPGDLCELWIHNDGVGTTSVQNFRIAYDDSANIAVASTNT